MGVGIFLQMSYPCTSWEIRRSAAESQAVADDAGVGGAGTFLYFKVPAQARDLS